MYRLLVMSGQLTRSMTLVDDFNWNYENVYSYLGSLSCCVACCVERGISADEN